MCWIDFHGFAHNSLILRPFLTREVSDRRSQHALSNGQGAVSPNWFLVWSMLWSNLSQTWSTSVKLGQTSPNSGKCAPRLHLEVILMWWALVGSGRLGSGCLVLHADTRENPGGKNGVMTVAPSLFDVFWHKERRTKNKWLDFCLLRFFQFLCPLTIVA